MVDRKIKSECRVGSLPIQHLFRIQEERRMEVRVPCVDSCDPELLERNIHIERLLDRHAFVADTDSYPSPKPGEPVREELLVRSGNWIPFRPW